MLIGTLTRLRPFAFVLERRGLAAAALILATCAHAQSGSPPVAPPGALPDRPHRSTADESAEMQALMAPHLAQARATYPDAKRRYLAGLPPGQRFYVVVRLHDGAGRMEQVFVTVDTIEGERVTGRIASKIGLVTGFHTGQALTFAEGEIVDWVILHPDGTEEGNYVGKFIDGYQVRRRAAAAPRDPALLTDEVRRAERLGELLYSAFTGGDRALYPALENAKATAERASVDRCPVPYRAVVVAPDGPAADTVQVFLVGMPPAEAGIMVGRHFRIDVSADGARVVSVSPSTAGCFVLQRPPPGAQRAFLTHLIAPHPNEFHVFVGRRLGLPLIVRTSSGYWGVEAGKIAFLRAP